MPRRTVFDRAGPVLVCGAGAAGLSAAIAAARAGASVWIVEARPDIGGTVVSALIHTIGGLFDSEGRLLNDGLPAELVDRLTDADPSVAARRMGRTWVLNVRPESYHRTVRNWITEEPRITVLRRTRVVGVRRDGNCIVEVELLATNGIVRARPGAIVDATGTAEVVRLVDPDLVVDESQRAAGGLIFTLSGVAPGTLALPRSLGIVRALRAAADDGTLPRECGKAWIDAGVSDDEVYVKLFVPLADGWRERREEITRKAHAAQAAVITFLRRLTGFEAAVLGRTGRLGVRDGGRVKGEYRLTGDDVRQGRRFADAVCRGSWPIEYWHPVEGVSIEYLPDGRSYDIPLRVLKVQGLRNVWAAGKCLSADRIAQASARVVGTCWAMGEAAGRTAASCREEACLGEVCESLQTSS